MPRPRPRWNAAFGPAVLLAALFVLSVSGPAAGQGPAGWKRGGTRPGSAPVPEPARVRPLESGAFYSNLGLLDTITREAVTSIVDSLSLPEGSAVTLYASNGHEANWFVGNLLAETLASRGFRVRIADWGHVAPAGNGPNSGKPPAQQGLKGAKQPGGQLGNGNPQGNPANGTAADTTGAAADSAASSDPLWGGKPDQAIPGSSGEEGANPAESEAAESPFEQAPPVVPGSVPAGNALDLRVVEFGVGYSDIGRRMLVGPVRFTRVGGVYLQVTSLKGPEGELRQVLSAERHHVDRLSGSQRSLAEGASYPFQIPELKSPGLGRYIEPAVVVGIVGSLVYLFYANQK
jgi:hypothetical protein